MIRHASRLNATELQVGVVERKTHRDKGGKTESTAAIYFWQDNGTRTIPKRETLRPAIRAFNYKTMARNAIRGCVIGNYRQAMQRGGEQVARAVKVEIMRIKSPPLKRSTIENRQRGGTNPLVDTGQLIRSISSKLS